MRDYDKIFERLIQGTADYFTRNNLHSQILGISGGIDSTVCAAICCEVGKRTGIPLIGRSLPSKYNKEGETFAAKSVGNAFCGRFNFEEIPIAEPYIALYDFLQTNEGFIPPTPNGNIQARIRMIYLRHLAWIKKGAVIDTDNLTENNLGYFTIAGDIGDWNPIGNLWKTEIFELAKYLVDFYNKRAMTHDRYDLMFEDQFRASAIESSLSLEPTAGLGITFNDLEEIGADSYEEVDAILQELLEWRSCHTEKESTEESKPIDLWLSDATVIESLSEIPWDVIVSVSERHFGSDFKRKQLPLKLKL